MISLRSAELFRLELRARMPFRYGIATMTEVPQLIARLTFEIDGTEAYGIAADLLPPKWFTKDPTRALADEIDEMLRVIRAAIRHAQAVRAPTVFAFWREVYAAQAAWAAAEKLPPLLSNFGTSFVERALIHALCRLRRVSLAAALRENLDEPDALVQLTIRDGASFDTGFDLKAFAEIANIELTPDKVEQ